MAPLPTIESGDNGYIPPTFINTKSIIDMHKSNRFSRGNDMTLLVAGTSEDRMDYLMGLTLFTVTTFLIFLLWTLAILVLKCCGSKRVGLFSGSPPRKAKPPAHDSKQQSHDEVGGDTVADVNSGQLPLEPEQTVVDGAISQSQYRLHPLDPLKSSVDNEIDDYPMLDAKRDRPTLGSGELAEGARTTNHSFASAEDSVHIFFDAEQSQPMIDVSTGHSQFFDARDALPESDQSQESEREGESKAHEIASNDALERHLNEVKRAETLALWSTIAIVFSGIGVIVSSGFFINDGVGSLATTLHAATDGMRLVSETLLDMVDIIDSFTSAQSNLTSAVASLDGVFVLNGFCPNKVDEWVAECLANGTVEGFSIPGGGNCTGVKTWISDALDTASRTLSDLQLDLADEVQAVRNDLVELSDLVHGISRTANSFGWAFYVSSAFAVLVDVLVVVLLLGTFWAWKEKLPKPFLCIRSFVVVPTFIFCTFLVWLFAMIFCFTAILTADFCFGGPDARVYYILTSLGFDFSSVTFQLVEYYLTGCVGPRISVVNDNRVAVFVRGFELIHGLCEVIMNIDNAAYSGICGDVDIGPLNAVATLLHAQLHIIADTLVDLIDFFSCSNIFPLIERITFEAVCYIGATALRNVYISLFCTLCFSFVFITFRAAWQENSEFI